MGSTTRRLLTVALAGTLVLLAPAAAAAQQYPPGGEPGGQPGEAEPDREQPPEDSDGEVLGESDEQGGGIVGTLARTGAGIATLTLVGLASLGLGVVSVRRARTG